MDCEKFDQHVMDALYGELDELTYEALKRHVEGCPRCGGVWSGLKATRSATTLPLDEPGDNLEDRILSAEKTVHRHAPWPRKIMRAAAWAGSHAMRPQLAMAALFMFVIGSSLLLLRARPGTMSAPVQVSEQGRPDHQPTIQYGERAARGGPPPPGLAGKADSDERRRDERPALEARAAAEPGGDKGVAGAAATAAASAGMDPSAASAPAPAPASPPALLADGRAKKESSGCEAGLPSFQAIVRDHPSSAEKDAAEREIEACGRSGGPSATPVDGGPLPSATGPRD